MTSWRRGPGPRVQRGDVNPIYRHRIFFIQSYVGVGRDCARHERGGDVKGRGFQRGMG